MLFLTLRETKSDEPLCLFPFPVGNSDLEVDWLAFRFFQVAERQESGYQHGFKINRRNDDGHRSSRLTYQLYLPYSSVRSQLAGHLGARNPVFR